MDKQPSADPSIQQTSTTESFDPPAPLPSLHHAPDIQRPASTSTHRLVSRPSPNHQQPRAAPYSTSRPSRKTKDNIATLAKPKIAKSSDNPRSRFLHDEFNNEYLLPAGPALNCTLVEILTILPNWFRNGALATRFLNNGISSRIHFLILREHRVLRLGSEMQCERARDSLSDAYRRVMRRTDPTWTKARHRVPLGWDSRAIAVNGVVPEGGRGQAWVPPASVVFKALANGMKKLAEGADAGDLTRALAFAMENQKEDGLGGWVDFLFPDDLQEILERVGRTRVTAEHTDLFAVARYGEKLREMQQARWKWIADMRMQQQATDSRCDVEAVAQQGDDATIQSYLASGVQMQLAPRQAWNLSQLQRGPTAVPYGSDDSQHDQSDRSQALSQANFDSASSIATLHYKSAISCADIGPLVFGQSNAGVIHSQPSPHSQANPEVASPNPYGDPPSSQSDADTQMVEAVTVWLAEHNPITPRADAGQQSGVTEPAAPPQDISEMQSMSQNEPVPQVEVREEWYALPDLAAAEAAVRTDIAEYGSIPPISDACRITEFENEITITDQALLANTEPGYQLFNCDELDAIWDPTQPFGTTGLLTPPKNVLLFGAETSIAPIVKLAGISGELSDNDQVDAGGVRAAPLGTRLIDCVEGDDVHDESDLARAVRWARERGELGQYFDVNDVVNIVDVMKRQGEY